MAINVCKVKGNIKNLINTAVTDANIFVDIISPFFHSDGTFIPASRSTTSSDANGDFEIDVIETATINRTIDFTIDYSDGISGRKRIVYSVVVPDQAEADLSDLAQVSPGVLQAQFFPATNVTVIPSGNLTSTNAQSALIELQTEIDGIQSDLSTIDTKIDGHIADTTNPHEVTLEQARTQNNQLTGNIDFNNNTGLNIPDPTLDGHISNKKYVDDQVSAKNHNDLNNIQGGSALERYHLTQAQHDTLTNGSNADSLHVHTLSAITDSGALAAKNTVTTTDIDNDAVTLGKIQDIVTDRVLGRSTVGTGDVEVLASLPSGVEGNIDHTNLQNIGTNTHAQIDTHIASTANPHNTALSNLNDYNANNNQIINVTDPTADQHAATKKYVDDSIGVAGTAVGQVAVRQTVLTGPKTDGRADFLEAGTGLEVLSKTTSDIIMTISRGFTEIGEINWVVKADSLLTWSSLTDDETVYLYIDYDDSTSSITTGHTTLAPHYGLERPSSPASGQFHYNTNHDSSPEVWNGSEWVKTNRLFVGECATDSGDVVDVISYAYQGVFHSDPISSGTNTLTTMNHNIGTEILFLGQLPIGNYSITGGGGTIGSDKFTEANTSFGGSTGSSGTNYGYGLRGENINTFVLRTWNTVGFSNKVFYAKRAF